MKQNTRKKLRGFDNDGEARKARRAEENYGEATGGENRRLKMVRRGAACTDEERRRREVRQGEKRMEEERLE